MKICKVTAMLTITELNFMIHELEVQDQVIYYSGFQNKQEIKIRKIDFMVPKKESNIDPPGEKWIFSIYCSPDIINEAKQTLINNVINNIYHFELMLKAKRKALKNIITNYKK